jgi:iron(III) transport system ATP-binding protein
MVFQSYAIWPHMTVAENVEYPLAGEGSRKERNIKVDEILQRLGLGALADRLAPNLSGGQQQRVALARALVAQPEILLLDEPLSNLDAKLREQMRFELKSLQESFGITTVYVTHDQEEALALSDRVGLMHEGALLEVGAPAQLYLHPAHKITADFLGTANFIPAHVQRGGNQPGEEMLLVSPIGSFLARRSVEWQRDRRRCYSSVPECEILVAAAPLAQMNHGAGVVERVTFLGNSADVIFRSGATAVRMRAHPARIPAVGKTVSFSVAPSACIVFRV